MSVCRYLSVECQAILELLEKKLPINLRNERPSILLLSRIEAALPNAAIANEWKALLTDSKQFAQRAERTRLQLVVKRLCCREQDEAGYGDWIEPECGENRCSVFEKS